MTDGTITPTGATQRLESIDVLRGIAVLGILVMNIRLFALPQAAYMNPLAMGEPSGIDRLVYWVTALFADQKFMTLFSLLFGAGLALISERCEARGRSATGLLYRRTFWLLLLGAAHAYLLWYGDILVIYSLCAFLVILARRRRPLTRLILGLFMLLIGAGLSVSSGLSFEFWPEKAASEALQAWAPDAEALAAEIATYQGGWMTQMAHRVPKALEFHTFVFLFWGLWRAGGLMLVGMALYRWGLFSAQWAPARYRRWAVLGLGLGLPPVALGIVLNERAGWDYVSAFFLHGQLNYWGSLAVALGYAAVIMLWCQGGRRTALRGRLAAVGRMAFTCYIAQTVVCTLLFYGHGLGWFGSVGYALQQVVVVAVCLILLVIAPWWLARYRFGPLEWLWRSLTYGSRQPLRRRDGGRAQAARSA